MPTPLFRKQYPVAHTVVALAVAGMACVASPVQAQPANPASTTAFRAEQPPVSTGNLRIIPLEPAALRLGKYEACRICGIVESISLTQYEDASDTAADFDEMADDVSGKSAQKSRRNILPIIKSPGSGAQRAQAPGKQARPALTYFVKVRMEDGTFRIVTQPSQPEFAVGDRVRVTSGAVITA